MDPGCKVRERMRLRTPIAAATAAGLLTLATGLAAVAQSGPGDPSSWEDEFAHEAMCFGHEAGDDSEHGDFVNGGASFRMGQYLSKWWGNHWEALVLWDG